MKKIDIKEFVDVGYLQEINRTFLHPLGLALTVKIDKNNNYQIDSILDFRDDDEGIYYDLANSDNKKLEKFKVKKENIERIKQIKEEKRKEKLGFNIEQI